MSHTVRLMPILPGKEQAARNFSNELLKERRADTDAFYARYGVRSETWSLQDTPMGLIGVVCTEIDDLSSGLATFAESSHPFDRWYKSRIQEITGVDMNQVQHGDPGAEQIFEWRPD